MLFYKSIMAATMIAIGCVANLVAMPSPLGAFLFPVGLIVVCGEGYKLATGMAKNLVAGDWEEFVCVFCTNVLFINLLGAFG